MRFGLTFEFISLLHLRVVEEEEEFSCWMVGVGVGVGGLRSCLFLISSSLYRVGNVFTLDVGVGDCWCCHYISSAICAEI